MKEEGGRKMKRRGLIWNMREEVASVIRSTVRKKIS